ncbi:hypothetical protein F5Y03DRAFT_247009 [Xylaria venustula]|nr:hypothetical protein F5Y03DRAFT_247009 [Xylaria venustula]
MSLLGFSARGLYIWTLLWNGIRVQAETELLVLGTPPIPTPVLTSTLTITTTVAYEPSLVPGNSHYTLVGCYSPLSPDRGRIFGPDDYDALSDNKIKPGNLTVDSCLQSCGSAIPPKEGKESYIYSGLRNGGECRCGNELPKDAHRLPDDDCATPCSGDPRLSCGGHDNIAVYSLISEANNKTSSSTPTNSETKQQPTTKNSPLISTPKTKATVSQAAASHEPTPSSAESDTHRKPITIGAVTGSLSGAIIVAAGLFLCYRARTRKKRIQDAHVMKSILTRRGRRSIQSPMLTKAEARSHIGTRHERDDDGTLNSRWGNTTHDEGSLVPNTPALESGGKFPAGLHPRTSTSGQSRGEAPASPRIYIQAAAGASSAVQWRDDDSNASSPQAMTHKRTKSSSSVVTPEPVARVDSLGDRAWHRRKLSTPYQPPAPAPGAIRGDIIARRGPPSGPPNQALPPMPPGMRARSQPRVSSRPGVVKEMSGNKPPPRPRRSFDTIDFEPGIGVPSSLKPGSESGNVPATDKESPLGMSRTNISTPTLGRYGSLSRSRSNRAYVESPVLGWQAHRQGSPLRGAISVDRQPKIPALPPVAPGERFDHRRWRGTVYAEPYEKERGRQRSRGDDISPLSASSTGTSVLFGLDEFDRRL